MHDSSILGAGFPFPVSDKEKKIEPAFGEDKIKQSVYQILMTRKGERVMRPDFGCGLWDYVFELPSQTYQNLMCAEIISALQRWEHRIEQVKAQIDASQLDKGRLYISVSYVVRATNRPDNLVFPFYLEEGL